MHRPRVFFALVFLTCLVATVHAQQLPTPEDYFGHIMGADGEIIDYLKSLDYYQLLAERSDRVLYTEIGKTTDGNPFAVVIISSPENLARLEEIRTTRNRLADPRKISDDEAKRIAAEMPAVVFHTGSIHSSEISCAQVPPEVVHRLASSNDNEVLNILENVVVLVSPSANPDGQVKYNEWYSEQKGKPWEGRMPWQYHSYVGHDNNRDWIMLHFPEQRLTATEIFLKWHPLYSHEMHEMGGTGARMFVPPYEDPLDSNTPPRIVNTMNMLGMAISHRLTEEGKGGVVMNAIFDLFTPARAFQIYHGGGRILTETARGNFARTLNVRTEQMQRNPYGSAGFDPLKASWNFPMPWKPGDWTFRDRVEYQVSANFALLNLAASLKYQFNLNQHYAMKYALEAEDWPTAYVFPPKQHNPGAAARLLALMQLGGLEIHRAEDDFSVGGRSYPAGSHVILLRQPYGAWAKTLLEIQEYPDLRRYPEEPPIVPYDVTGHTLPLLMGVDTVAVSGDIDIKLVPVDEPIETKGIIIFGSGGYALSGGNDVFSVVDDLLDAGFEVGRLTAEYHIPTVARLEKGTFIVYPKPGLEEALREQVKNRCFNAIGTNEFNRHRADLLLNNPRIAIYEPWGGTMDAGWTRLILEQFGIEFETIRNKDVRDGDLNNRFDVILFTGELRFDRLLNGLDSWPEEYTGGIGDEGVANLESFIRGGGTVVGWGGTSMVLAEVFDIPLTDGSAGLDSRSYFDPGSVVLAELDLDSPLNYGMPEKAAVMVRRCPLFVPTASVEPSPKFVGKYPDYDPRLSGFLLGPEHMQGTGAVAIQAMGKGKVVLFAYLPQFRAMTDGTYRQLFNIFFWPKGK